MTDDQIAGTFKKAVGHVEDAFGGLTGDINTQIRGKFDQATGSAQEVLGQARGKAKDLYSDIEDFTKAQPLTALAITLGVGALLGALVLSGRRRD